MGGQDGSTPARAADSSGGALPAGLPEAHRPGYARPCRTSRTSARTASAPGGGPSSSPGSAAQDREFWPAGFAASPPRRGCAGVMGQWDPIPRQAMRTGATRGCTAVRHMNPAVMKGFGSSTAARSGHDVPAHRRALAKIRTGQLKFDVFFPTIDSLGKLCGPAHPAYLHHIPHLESDVFDGFGTLLRPGMAVHGSCDLRPGRGRRDIISDESVRALEPWTLLGTRPTRGRSASTTIIASRSRWP